MTKVSLLTMMSAIKTHTWDRNCLLWHFWQYQLFFMFDQSTVQHHFCGWNNWVTLASILDSDTFIEEQPYKVIKTWSRMSNCYFCRFMTVLIVHDVKWTIGVAAISTHDYQQSWLSRPLLNSTSFVSSYVRFMTLKNINQEVNIVHMWQIKVGQWKIQILSFCHFPWLPFWARPQGSHINTNCHC